ncbi:protein FAM169B isoform X2 [Phyllopteryx taeniolatus]|uniref:protein FAM169B isoform X2 n=1 Tax=Phyllopteryx taeniolatus TaxID=161469 RepID=UPI002AD3FB6B|nr:protein FAM169B isoform X2 [Phyllopteryx taeniolatus]
MFPVDLPLVEETDLRSASEQYLLSLESRPKDNEWFQSPKTSKLEITANSIKWLQLFEDDQTKCSILALHPPGDPSQVVALYLHGSWWCVNDVIRTSCESRTDLLPVVEMPSQEETLFSMHTRLESAKLLWRDGQAVGFYTVKHKGSLCDSWSGRCYQLPVLDTVLVRRSWRRRGLGLKMLADFCSSFPSEEVLGISVPLSASMVAVCRHFLHLNEDHRDRLYEVEAPGAWTQQRNIWLNIQLSRYLLTVDEVG